MTTHRTAHLLRREGDLLASGLNLQASLQGQGLGLLLAEMHALADLLPGMPHAPRTEAETEADFDNMPV